MKKRKYPNAIRNKELAEIMSKESEGEYWSYEILDILDLLCDTIEDLVKQGEVIELYDFGAFRPKFNPSRKMYSALKGMDVVTKESNTLEFTPSITLQTRVKTAVREKE